MPSTEEIARGYIEAAYSKAELQQLLKSTLAKYSDPDMITAASTGSGTSYARTQRTSPDTIIAALRLALWMLDHPGEPIPTPAQQLSPVVIMNS